MLNNGSTAVTVTSVTLNLVYNPSLLTIANVPGAVDTTSTPGVAIVTFSSSGLIIGPGGGAIFANLTASVPSTAGYGEKEILDLQNININNGSFTSGNGLAIDDDAIHVSGFLGNVTGDGIYTGLDAQRISRVAVGLDPGFRQWVLADPLIVGDVSGDNVLTGLDALQIARQAVGITQGNIPVLPGVTPEIAGPDPVMSISADLTANPQATVEVPVNLTHPNGLDAVDLAISYDPSRLDVISTADVMRGSLTETFDNFTVNLDRAAGIIRISGYRSAGPLSGLAEGSVAVIGFRVRDNAPAGPAIINLMQNVGTTWSLPGGTDAQGNDFLFDLQPRVSNAAGDPLDGRIIILQPMVVSQQATAELTQPSVVSSTCTATEILAVQVSTGAAPQATISQVTSETVALSSIVISSVKTTQPPSDAPAAGTPSTAVASFRALVNSLMALFNTQAATDSSPVVVYTSTGTDTAPAAVPVPDGRMSPPASVNADLHDGVYNIDTVKVRMPDGFNRFFESDAKIGENRVDDFFSRYPAIVEDGNVGEALRLQVEKDLAVLTADEKNECILDAGPADGMAWLDDADEPQG